MPDDGVSTSTRAFIGSRNGPIVEDVILFVVVSGGKPRLSIESNNTAVNITATNSFFSDGQQTWHHLTVVVDATAKTATLYGDGINIGSASTAALDMADFTTDQNIWIGAANNNGAVLLQYAGLIDDVRIYDIALTAEQVNALYQQATEFTDDFGEPGFKPGSDEY